MQFSVLIRPRGLIKIVEIAFAITAFSLLVDYSDKLTFYVICSNNTVTTDSTISTSTPGFHWPTRSPKTTITSTIETTTHKFHWPSWPSKPTTPSPTTTTTHKFHWPSRPSKTTTPSPTTTTTHKFHIPTRPSLTQRGLIDDGTLWEAHQDIMEDKFFAPESEEDFQEIKNDESRTNIHYISNDVPVVVKGTPSRKLLSIKEMYDKDVGGETEEARSVVDKNAEKIETNVEFRNEERQKLTADKHTKTFKDELKENMSSSKGSLLARLIYSFLPGKSTRINRPTTPPPNPVHMVKYDIKIEYPFRLDEASSSEESCSGETNEVTLEDDISSSAIFFVFTGVTFFLFCLAALAFYVIFDEMYQNSSWVNIGDLIIHTIFVIFWFSGSVALAVGVGDLNDDLTEKYVIKLNGDLCDGNYCKMPDTLDVTEPVVATLFGFASFFICLANLWFIFKETGFYESE